MKNIVWSVMGIILLVALAYGNVESDKTVTIDSEEVLGRCLEEVQRQYLPVSLPSLSARLLQPAGCFPVDFNGFDPAIRKYLRGWIDEHGVVRYTVGLYEDYWTGEIVVQDHTGWEIFRIQREKSYDPYDYQRALFSLGKREVLANEFSRRIFHPSKISTVAELVPLVFWDAHLQAEQEAAALARAMEPMMIAMSFAEEMTEFKVMQDGTDISVNLPDEFAGADILLEQRTNLVSGVWIPASTNQATSSGTMLLASADIPEIVISGTASTNSTPCTIHTFPDFNCTNCMSSTSTDTLTRSGGVVYYRTSASSAVDSDGDGLNNVSEYEVGTDYLDSDSDDDGVSDGYEVLVLATDPMVSTNFSQAQIDAHDTVSGDPDGDSSPDWKETLDGTNPRDFFD